MAFKRSDAVGAPVRHARICGYLDLT
jgi:hypothetical protein